MVPSPDSAETAKTTTPFRLCAAAGPADFPSPGAEAIMKAETNSRANRNLKQFVNKLNLVITLDHSLLICSVELADIIQENKCQPRSSARSRIVEEPLSEKSKPFPTVWIGSR
jgi:hypothetical protein